MHFGFNIRAQAICLNEPKWKSKVWRRKLVCERGPEVPDIETEVHRRILRFLNAARRPEDLMAPPKVEKIQVIDDHVLDDAIEDHVREVRVRDIGREPLLDKELAERVFEEREKISPIYGFQHIRQLLDIKDFDFRIVPFFGRAVYGEWEELILKNPDGTPLVHKIEHAAVLCSGKVIMWGDPPEYFLWEPSPPPGADPEMAWEGFPTTYLNSVGVPTIFEPVCSGHSFLSDGKLLVCGGEPKDTIDGAWKFDPAAEIWERTAGDMAETRWYPTVVTLGDDSGRALVASGVYNAATPPLMEIYSESTDTFTPVTVTGPIDKAFPQTYPGLNVLPSGAIFYTPVGFEDCGGTPDPTSFPGNSIGESSYFAFSDALTGSWNDIGANFRDKGMSLLFLRLEPTEPDRVMVVGGGVASDMATSQVIDISTATPSWGAKTSMNQARRNVNVVQLPDGSVFACGGMDELSSPVYPCELYNPATNTWSPMDSLTLERAYHSVAVLLPDGRVMSTGGGGDCALSFNTSLEIFSPPYLFNPDGSPATRPEITSFPDPGAGEIVLHGSTFEIGTADPCDISRVIMVRPMAVTHQTDTEQRILQLTFTKSGPTTLSVTAPDGRVYPYGGIAGGHSHSIASRGYYMLFILNNSGVPSVAKFIRLR